MEAKIKRKEMRIFYVTPEYIDETTLQPIDGGLASYLNKVTRFLTQKGHDITVLIPNSLENKQIDYQGIHVIFARSKYKRTIWQKLIWPFLNKKIRKKIKMDAPYQTIHRVIRILHRKQPIDIIQYASYLSMGKYPEKDIPSCVRISSYTKLWQKYYNCNIPCHVENEVIQFQNARFMYGPSKYIANYIKQDLDLKNDIQIIETPFVPYSEKENKSIWLDLRKHLKGKPYLLFFGSIGLLKGALEIADSIGDILKKYCDLHLVLVGKEILIDGESPVQIIKEKARVNANRVISYDSQPQSTLFPLIHHAKAVLLPSRIDNLPNACIEAMGLKKIVIGSRGASFEQLIEDGKNGLLCQAGNSESIEKAVDKLMSLSKEQIQNMEQKAYERIQKLNLDTIIEQTLDYYQYVIENWRKKMKLLRKEKKLNSRRHIYLFGIKVLSYKRKKKAHKLSLYDQIFAKRFQGLTEQEMRYCLEKQFLQHTGSVLNLDNPQTFNEKLQWLKLYHHRHPNPLMTKCADKVGVREYIKEKIGEKYLVPCLGIWDNPDDIDFSKLPNQFVLKVNWGSGQNIIVKDKAKLDIEEAKRKLAKWMKPENNHYFHFFEWCYKDIQPKIIAEKYMNFGEDLFDYKIMCYNGVPQNLFVCSERRTDLKVTFFDLAWKRLPFIRKYPASEKEIQCPEKFKEMLKISEILAKPFSFVRVDFFCLNDKLYIGEMTFFPGAGHEKFDPVEWDKKLGDLLILPKEK